VHNVLDGSIALTSKLYADVSCCCAEARRPRARQGKPPVVTPGGFADPAVFHAGQVSNPEQNAIVNGFPTSPYFPAAISKATSGSSSLSIPSSINSGAIDPLISFDPFVCVGLTNF
jgi:hypothetical protein